MKFLAVLLIACVVMLSPLSGMMAAPPAAKTDCCKHMAGKSCQPKPAKNNDGCSKPNCTMLFSCSICGFLTVEQVQIEPALPRVIAGSVSQHQPGCLSAYTASNWKPPKLFNKLQLSAS